MADKSDLKLTSLPGNVYLLTLAGKGEHRFNPTSIAAINRALDQVENDPNAAALVTTNEGKFFSNGLDLALFMKDPSQFDVTVNALHQLLKRLLLFPMPVIAAICGHAAAGGCMLALAQDYQYMSADRGYIFLSEIDIKLPLTPGMNALIHAKIPGKAFYKAVLSGHKFNGKSAVEHGFIEAALPDAASTLEAALKHAKALAARKFDRGTYKAMKMEMFKTLVKELDEGGNPTSINAILSRL
jgi:enoyl-CoA hydratase/carnithine racemase